LQSYPAFSLSELFYQAIGINLRHRHWKMVRSRIDSRHQKIS